jgi:ribosomal protein S12 methylthiotransferase accessory factor
MNIQVSFGEGMQVNARFDKFTVHTDQPESNGGENTAPDPYSYFLTSLVTCAGFFVLRFCQARNIPMDGISLSLENDWDAEQKLVKNIAIKISLPPSFPAKYTSALIRATNECSVKRALLNPPNIEVNAVQTVAA